MQELYSTNSPPAHLRRCCNQKHQKTAGCGGTCSPQTAQAPKTLLAEVPHSPVGLWGFALVISVVGIPTLNHAKFAMESFRCNEQFVESPAPKEIACPNSTQPAGMMESPRKQENHKPVPPTASDRCPQPPQRACVPAACASKGDGGHQSLRARDPLPHPDLRDLPGPSSRRCQGAPQSAASGAGQDRAIGRGNSGTSPSACVKPRLVATGTKATVSMATASFGWLSEMKSCSSAGCASLAPPMGKYGW